MSEGFKFKPPEVKEAIAKGDKEALSAMGKKGAANRAEIRDEELEALAHSEIERIKRIYPDGVDEEGNLMSPEEIEHDAYATAEAILKMRNRQRQMMKGKKK